MTCTTYQSSQFRLQLDYILCLFFFNATPTTVLYTLSLHDALPICRAWARPRAPGRSRRVAAAGRGDTAGGADRRDLDRKSTRLNSSHPSISYAVFCLKKKRKYRKKSLPASYTRPLTRVSPPKTTTY